MVKESLTGCVVAIVDCATQDTTNQLVADQLRPPFDEQLTRRENSTNQN